MRALITGVAGFVGSHLAEYLIANTDWEIFGLMRWNDPLDNLEKVIPIANRYERICFMPGDICDRESMRHVFHTAEPDYVFHLAAQSYVPVSFTAPATTFDANIIGTLNVLEAARTWAGRFRRPWVHVCSSSEVYGRVKREFLPIKEDCPFSPASPYSISKVAADMLGMFHAEAYDMNVQVTRMFTHTGPRRGDVFAESSFAKQIAMIEAGQIEGPIKVGNLDSLRTIADVRDAVRAYHMLLTVNPQKGAVYNIGGSHTCTVGAILDALMKAAGKSYRVEVDAERLRPLDADLQVPDCSKFKAHTGWAPTIPFEQTMADLLEYWRDRVKRGPCLQR